MAGKEAKGQILGFSQSEMWSMPKSRIDSVIRRSATLGVKTTMLGPDWNHVWRSPSLPEAMIGARETVMNSMKALKETMGLGVMTAPDPAVVEYALMKDAEAKAVGARAGALPPTIVIPLNDKESITVRRTSVDMKENGCTWRGAIDLKDDPLVSRGEGSMLRPGTATRKRTDLKGREDSFDGLVVHHSCAVAPSGAIS